MSEEDFRKLYRIIAESYAIDAETANQLLQRILGILTESCMKETVNEVLQM